MPFSINVTEFYSLWFCNDVDNKWACFNYPDTEERKKMIGRKEERGEERKE